MNLVVNERRPSSTACDVFRAHAPTTDQSSPRATNGGIKSDRFYREWSAQRKWEDDGGRIAQDLTCLSG
jgi:hypothetical protein